MRIGLGLLGFLAGAAAGLVLAMLLLFLWYDVLRIGDRGGDGLSGLASLMVFGPLGALAGGLGGAYWAIRSAGGRARGVAITVLAALLLLAAWVLLGPGFLF